MDSSEDREETSTIGFGSPWAGISSVFRQMEEEMERKAFRRPLPWRTSDLLVLHRWSIYRTDPVEITLN